MPTAHAVRSTSVVHPPREPLLLHRVEIHAIARTLCCGIFFLCIFFLHASKLHFHIPLVLNPLLFPPPFPRCSPRPRSLPHLASPALQKNLRGCSLAQLHRHR